MATVAQALHLDGELVGQLIARAPRWITALLVVLLGIRAATLVAGLAGGSAPPPPEPVRPLPVRNVVDIPSILRANLFGQSAPVAGTAPVTSMALVLGGVIADVDEKRGFAMLGSSPTDIKLYRVGQTVPGGASLHAVMVDRVLLDRGGTVETLLMPLRAGAAAAPPLTSAASPAQPAQRVQQLIRENPNLINQVIQRTPVLAEGKLRGIRVYPGSNAQAFSKLGLRPGDMVTAINGTTLEGQTRADEIFNTLSNAAEARVTVMRNNSPLDLQLNLAEVASEAERLSVNPPTPDGVPPPAAPESAR